MTYALSSSFASTLAGITGATVTAYKATRLATPPAVGTTPPGSPDAGPVTAGPSFGAPGAWILTVTTFSAYWVAALVGGVYYWSFYPASSNNASELEAFNVSGSGQTGLASAGVTSPVITTSAPHDFKVGQGIQVWGAGPAPAPTFTPAAPTVAAVGTNDTSVTYEYQVVSIGNRTTVNGITPASAAATFVGNSTLDHTNYNRISWTPTYSMVTNGYDAYAVYGRMGGSMRLLGTVWLAPPVSLTANNASVKPPYFGPNMLGSTTYTYSVTGVDFFGNESPVLATTSRKTAATPKGINIHWNIANRMLPYQDYKIYRTGGFMAQIPVDDRVWQDNGTIAPGAAPPTMVSFSDLGQTPSPGIAPGVGGPPNIPLTPSATAVGRSIVTTVTAVTNTTIQLSVTTSSAITHALVTHDDTAALNTALSTLDVVNLTPGGRYFLSGSGVTVPAGKALVGPSGPTIDGASTSVSANPLPQSAMACLCMTSYNSPGVSFGAGGTYGASCESLMLFWPYQINGWLGATPTVKSDHTFAVPYAPGLYFLSSCTMAKNIVDCNSWVGMLAVGGINNFITIRTSTIRWAVALATSESKVESVRGDRGSTYSHNRDMVRVYGCCAVRCLPGGTLNTISDIGCDGIGAVHCTVSGVPNGGGGVGSMVDTVWCDDVGKTTTPGAVVFDVPVGMPYSSGGSLFQAYATNINLLRGCTAPIVFNAGPFAAPTTSGSNKSMSILSNVYTAANVILQGAQSAHFSNVFFDTTPSVTCTCDTSLVLATPAIHVTMTGCSHSVTRLKVLGGKVKAYVSANNKVNLTGTVRDRITGGSLYVIDEEAMRTSRFHIPAGTALTAGKLLVGYLMIPRQKIANSNFVYVVSATAAGTSTSDKWMIDTTTLVTTSTSATGLFLGARGEGVTPGELLQAIYTQVNPGGASTHVGVLPVYLTVHANVTTTGPIDCEIAWCVTPSLS